MGGGEWRRPGAVFSHLPFSFPRHREDDEKGKKKREGRGEGARGKRHPAPSRHSPAGLFSSEPPPGPCSAPRPGLPARHGRLGPIHGACHRPAIGSSSRSGLCCAHSGVLGSGGEMGGPRTPSEQEQSCLFIPNQGESEAEPLPLPQNPPLRMYCIARGPSSALAQRRHCCSSGSQGRLEWWVQRAKAKIVMSGEKGLSKYLK